MVHNEQSPLARNTVKIKKEVKHPQVSDFGGSEIHIEDWWDKVSGKSWMDCEGNPACLIYAARTGFSDNPVPTDDDVLYGKIGPYGHLVHLTELDLSE